LHRLKDLTAPEPLYQLAIPGLPDSFPPLKALYNANLPTQPAIPVCSTNKIPCNACRSGSRLRPG
jgi:hypothetical protein